MLISARAITEVMEILTAADFYRPAHSTIFEVIIELVGGGCGIDAVTVADELQKRSKLANVGGPKYLYDLTQIPPTAVNAVHYARIVVDKSIRRRLVEFGTRCEYLAHECDSDEMDEMLAQIETYLRNIRQPQDQLMSFNDMVLDWHAWVDADPSLDVIPTPWFKVNDLLAGGLYKSKLYIFGGRPGQGKSISALNIAASAAENGKSVMVFSLEMPKNEVTSRLLAAGAQVSFQQIMRREMRQETDQRIKTYAAQNAGMKFYCVDKANITVEQIAAHCRSIKDLDMVVIDYVQLVKATDKRVSRDQQVAHISQALKVLAKEMNIAVVLAAQLNRQVIDPKTGKARIPTLSDLRESGSLEADADAVLFLHRPDEDDGTVDIVIAKNRSGLIGVVPLVFVGQQARLG